MSCPWNAETSKSRGSEKGVRIRVRSCLQDTAFHLGCENGSILRTRKLWSNELTIPWDEKQNLEKSVHHQPSAVDRQTLLEVLQLRRGVSEKMGMSLAQRSTHSTRSVHSSLIKEGQRETPENVG